MVEVRTQMQAEPSVIKQRMNARVERLRKLNHRPGLRVEPANDDMRRLLKHPSGMGFRSSGSSEWPDDTYTRRRIRDGDIKVVEGQKEKAHGRHAHRSGDAA